ncbi:hypothetical protein F5879DRAFT_72384 [Lentinula edodes]|nr:hypothetical protein F5879DRAFT_72384 [Lentinula edodes]
MPSLRRTVSSPAVRSSPYPTLSSSGQLSSGPATRPGHSHRRPSGSEIATRRVLADIEWWRVTDGQRDLEAEQNGHEQSPPRTAGNLMDMLEGLVSPLWPGFSEVYSIYHTRVFSCAYFLVTRIYRNSRVSYHRLLLAAVTAMNRLVHQFSLHQKPRKEAWRICDWACSTWA